MTEPNDYSKLEDRKKTEVLVALKKLKNRGLSSEQVRETRKLAQEDITSMKETTNVSRGIEMLRGVAGPLSIVMMNYDPYDSVVVYDSDPFTDGMRTIDMTDSTDPA